MKKYLKAIGQLLLITAFLVQWSFLERIESKDRNQAEATTGYSIARLAAQNWIQLYEKTQNAEYLQRAAKEEANAIGLILLYSDNEKQTKKELMTELREKAKSSLLPVAVVYFFATRATRLREGLNAGTKRLGISTCSPVRGFLAF